MEGRANPVSCTPDYEDKVFALVTDQLDPFEQTQMEKHLQGCPECRRDVDELREVLAGLTYALTPVNPPQRLREQTLHTAFATRPAENPPVLDSFAAAQSTPGATPADRSTSGQAPPTRRRKDWRWLWQSRYGSIPVAAMLSLAVVGLGVQSIWQHQQLQTLHSQLIHTQVATYTLRPTSSLNTHATGQVFLVHKGSATRLVVVLQNTPATAGAQVYHVWLLHNHQRMSGGILRISADGQGVLSQTLQPGEEHFNGIGITLEPNPNTTQPTGPKVFGTSV